MFFDFVICPNDVVDLKRYVIFFRFVQVFSERRDDDPSPRMLKRPPSLYVNRSCKGLHSDKNVVLLARFGLFCIACASVEHNVVDIIAVRLLVEVGQHVIVVIPCLLCHEEGPPLFSEGSPS